MHFIFIIFCVEALEAWAEKWGEVELGSGQTRKQEMKPKEYGRRFLIA